MSGVVATNPFVVSDRSIDTITSQIAALDDQRAAALAQLQGDEALADTSAPDAALSKTARHEILGGDPAYQAALTTAHATARNSSAIGRPIRGVSRSARRARESRERKRFDQARSRAPR